jgi:RHS repeat-associated protein
MMLTTPYVTNLGLVNDTGTPGDGITTDARIGGTLEDSDMSGMMYYVEVDLNGDQMSDSSIYSYPGSSFEYDPGMSLAPGPVTVSFRAVESDMMGATLYGAWQDFTFTYEDPYSGGGGSIAQVTSLTLKNDTKTAGDLITYDPRVIGQLSDPDGMGSSVMVEIDMNYDGMAEDTIYVNAGSSFEYNPSMMMGIFGSLTVQARTYGYDTYTYMPVYGAWQTLTFQFDSVLDEVSLTNLTASTAEGTSASFTLNRPADFEGTITVEAWPRAKSDATHPADPMYDFDEIFTSGSGGSGTSTINVNVPANDDNVDEYDEEFEVEFHLSVMDLYYDWSTLSDLGVVTILDTDAPPVLSLQRIDLSGMDRDSNGVLLDNIVPEFDGVARFNVMFSHPSQKDVDLTYGTQDGTALGIAGPGFDFTQHNQDFELFSGRLQPLGGLGYYGMTDFPGGTIEINLNDDWWHEGQETFSIDLAAATNATLASSSIGVTIDDDSDDTPTAYIPDTVEVIENDPADLLVEIRLSNPSLQTVTVDYATVVSQATPNATPGEDYETVQGTASFASGVTVNPETVVIIDDEPWRSSDPLNHPWWEDEFFDFKLSNPVNARLFGGMWYMSSYKTEVRIIDEQSFPNMTVTGPATLAEGATMDYTFSFDQVFETTEVLNYTVYWDFDDYQWWEWHGGIWEFSGDVCNSRSWLPPGEFGAPVMSGSMTLTPTGLHSFTRPISAPIVNGMHDPSRFIRVVFEWENEDFMYDPPQQYIGLNDDTTEPQITSFTLTPNTVDEGFSVDGVVTLDNSSSVPQLIDFDVVGAGYGGQTAVTLPWDWWHGFKFEDVTVLETGQTSAAVTVLTVLDDPTGDKILDISATARWNGSSAISPLTIVDVPYGPSRIPPLITGTFDIPEDRFAGEVVGNIFAGADGSEVSVEVTSNNGPFAVSLSGDTEGYITYTGSQSLSVGSTYSLTYEVSDGWNVVAKTVTFEVVPANNTAPSIVLNEPLTITAGVGANALVGSVAATDPNGDVVRYELDDPTGMLPFVVNSATGEIRTTDAFAATAGTTFAINVIASDNLASATRRTTLQVPVSVSVVAEDRRTNVAPIAVRDTAIVSPGATVLIDVLGNDSDAESSSLSLQIHMAPSAGAAAVVFDSTLGRNVIAFEAANAGRGIDTFTYAVTDNVGNQSHGSVTVSIGLAPDQQGQFLLAAQPDSIAWVQPYLQGSTWYKALGRLADLGYRADVVIGGVGGAAGYDGVAAISFANGMTISNTGVSGAPGTGGSKGLTLSTTEDELLYIDASPAPVPSPLATGITGPVTTFAGSLYPPGGASPIAHLITMPSEYEPSDLLLWGPNRRTSCDTVSAYAALVQYEDADTRIVAAGGHAVADLDGNPNNTKLWDNAFEWVLDSNGFATATVEEDALYYFVVSGYAQSFDSVGSLPVTTSTSFAMTTTQSAFSYDETSGEITVDDPTTLVVGATYALNFNVLDVDQNITGQAEAYITVSWPNRTPSFNLPAGPFAVDENTAAGTIGGVVSATDPDPATILTYGIVSGNTSPNWTGDAFTINANGEISVANRDALDFETTPTFDLTVEVSDDVLWDTLTDSVTVTINLNDLIIDVDPTTFNAVPENSPAGTVVGTIAPRDWPSMNAVTYTVLQVENGSGLPYATSSFQIITEANGRDGRLEVVDPGVLNFEFLAPGHILRLSVRAEDGDLPPNSDTEWFEFAVADVNEPPTDITLLPDSIDENSDTSSGALPIGLLSAEDEDLFDSYTFTLVAGSGDADNASFEVVGNALSVRQGVVLNFETQPEYFVRVNVLDGGGHNFEKALVVSVNDLNESPTNITLTPDSIDENTDTTSGDVTIGVLVATDEDFGSSSQFTLATGPGDTHNSSFVIVDNELKIKQGTSIDREATPELYVRVNAFDGANNFEQAIVVTVNDLNDNPTLVVPSQTIGVPEDAAIGSTHGPVNSSDADTPAVNPALAWSLTGTVLGDDGFTYPGVFDIDPATGHIIVLDNSVFDSENTSFPQSFTLTVEVTDQVFVDQKTITVAITDVNDNPPVVLPGNIIMVLETAVTASETGWLLAIDPDALHVLGDWDRETDVIGDDSQIHNEVLDVTDEGKIVILDASQIDFENPAFPKSYTFDVSVSDGLHRSVPVSITVMIMDVNDNSPVITPGQSFSISEDASNSASVGTVAATDVDTVGGPLQNWMITGGNSDGIFAIDSNSGEITVIDNVNLDRESTDVYVLSVTVTDGPNLSATETVTINVLDVNDNPPVIPPGQSFPVSEAASNGFVVGTVQATDADTVGGPLLSWQITGGNSDGIFAINGVSGEITVVDNSNLDRETTDLYILTVTVSDTLFPSASQSVTINVLDVNDNAPIVTPNQTIAIPENAANSSLHGPVLATDADITGTLQNWQIVGDVIGNDAQIHNDVFSIVAATGQIIILDNTKLDHEAATPRSYTFNVAVDDGPNTSAQQSVTVTLTDLNDVTPVINVPVLNLSVLEDAPAGTIVGTLTATDPDTVGTIQDWTIVSGNTKGVFAINPSTGVITVADPANLDFETQAAYTLGITVTDGANLGGPTNITIDVTNVVEAPEISVRQQNGPLIVDGTSVVNFGETQVGTPVVFTFEVTNHGDTDLDIGIPFLTVPNGYTLGSLTPTSLIAPGGTSTFTVTLDATAPGTYAGPISFSNNDDTSDGLNENPFNFDITGVVASTSEIEVSYLEGGSFESGGIINFGSTLVGEPQTFHLLVTNSGEEDLVITWPDPISASGSPSGYSISVSNAVSDGMGNRVLTVAPNAAGSIVTIDFTAAMEGFFNETFIFPSNDFDEPNFALQLIGRVKPTTLPGTEPAFFIIDDGDPGYTEGGTGWDTPQSLGYESDYRRHDPGLNGPSDYATWSFAGLASGRYRVSATWLPRYDREGESLAYDGNAQYNVFDADPDGPATLLDTIVLNQRSEPDDLYANGAVWEDISVVEVSGTTLSVRLYAPDSSLRTRVTADAIRVERLDVEDDVLRLPGGRAYYTFDVRGNDAGNDIDPRAKDTALTGLTVAEAPTVQTVTTISGSGLSLDPGDPNLWVTASGTSIRRNPDGTLTYTPADPFAPDVTTFDYALAADPTVVFSFRNENPILHDDDFFVSHTRSLTFDVRANDVDPEGDALTATIQGVKNGRLGTPVMQPDGSTKQTIVDASRLAIEAPKDETWTLELRWDGGPWQQVFMNPNDDFVVLKSQIEASGGLPGGVSVESWQTYFEPRVLPVQFVGMTPGTVVEARINPANPNVKLHDRGELIAHTDGTFTYAPNEDFFRAHGVFTEEFRYVAEDSEGNKGAEPAFTSIAVINSAPSMTGLDHVFLSYDDTVGTTGNRFFIPLAVYDADGDQLELFQRKETGTTTVGTFEFAGNAGIYVEDGGVIFQTSNTGVQGIVYRVFDGYSFSSIFASQLSSLDGPIDSQDIIDGVPLREYHHDGVSLDAAGWTIDAEHFESQATTTAIEQIGSSSVDLNTGTFQIAHPLDFDLRQSTGSDGQYQLVYNSDADTRQPFIQGRISRHRSTLEPTTIEVALKWFKVVDVGSDNYQLDELSGFSANRSFTNLSTDLEDYLFSIQTPLNGQDTLVDLYGNGVYRWQIEANVTFDNSTSELISMQGESLLVGDDTAVAKPFHLPSGWEVGGLPSLWVDLNNTSSRPGLGNPAQDDTAILVDAAGEETLFVSSRFQSDHWKAVEPGTRTQIPKDLGTLNYDDQAYEFTYTAVDGTVLTFKYDEPVGNDDRGFFASLREIDPVVGPSTTFDYHPDGRIDNIVAADGSITTFAYSGTTLTQIQQPGGRNLNIGSTTVGSDSATQLTIGNYVRTIVYDADDRVQSDISGSGTNQVETHFGYDANGYLSSVTLGNAANGGASTYAIRPAALFTQDAQDLPDAFIDANYTVAELVIPTSDLKKFDGTSDGADLGYELRTYYKFDEHGRVFETATYATTPDGGGQHQLVGNPISRTTTEWDHFDNAVASTDSLGRETRFTYDYSVDSSQLINEQYLAAFSSPPPTADEADKVFGNLTEVFRLYRQAAYDYENEFGLLIEEVDAAGNHTRYFRDSKGLAHFIDGVDGFFEIFDYGTLDGHDDILTSHINTLGLTTVIDSVDANRRVTQQTTIDSYGASETSTVTFDYSNPLVDKATTTGGTVRNAVEIEFDALDRIVRTESFDANGTLLRRNTATFHDNSLLATATDGEGVRVDFAYDRRGYVTSQTNGAQVPAVAESTTTTYYSDGSIREQVFPDGHTERQFVDPANFTHWSRTDRVWQVDASDAAVFGEMVVEIAADRVGNIVRAENKLTGQVTKSSYDALDRLVTQTLEDVQLSYDAGQSRSDLTSRFTYDAVGNLRQQQSPGVAALVTDYNGLGYVTRIENVADGGAINSFKLDPAGGVLESTEHRSTPAWDGSSITYTRSSYVTSFEYDGFGRLREQADPDNAATTYAISFDSTENLTRVSVNDRDSVTTHQLLDGAGQLRQSVDTVGATTAITYDLAGRLTSVTLDSAASESIAVHRKTDYGYDDLGRRNSVQVFVDPTSGTAPVLERATTFINTVADGRKVVVTGANGAQTVSTSDSVGKLIQVDAPDPGPGANGTTPDHGAQITKREYKYLQDANGPVGRLEVRTITTSAATATDPNPIARRTVTTESALGLTLINTETVAQTTGGTWPAGDEVVRFVYDEAGRVFDQLDIASNRTRFSYDDATGQPFEVFVARVTTGLPSVVPTKTLYDSAGRTVSVTDQNGNETVWAYDSLGRSLSESTDIEQIGTGGQISTVSVERTWNYNGLESTVTDRNGRVTKITADPANRKITEEWFSSSGGALERTFVSTFDAGGELRTIGEFPAPSDPAVDDPEKLVRFDYDGLGRIVEEWSDYTFNGAVAPTTRFTTTYHDAGPRHTVALRLDLTPDTSPTDDTDVSVTTYDIDELGRVIGIKQDLATASQPLWANTSVGPDKAVTFKYNADGTRAEVVRLAHLSYSETPSSVFRGVTSYDYLGDGRLNSINHLTDRSPSTSPIANYGYTYNGDGTIDSWQSLFFLPGNLNEIRDERRNYAYDEYRQLIEVAVTTTIGSATDSHRYLYDASGNRVGESSADNPNNLTDPTATNDVRKSNRIFEDDAYTYKYDNEGNLVERTAKSTPAVQDAHRETYVWDHRNRLITVEQFNASDVRIRRVDYAYDPLDRHVATEVNSYGPTGLNTSNTFTGHVRDGNQVVLDLNLAGGTNNRITKAYLNGPAPNEVIAVDVAGQPNTETVWLFSDTAGAIRSVARLDASVGWLFAHRHMDSFGNVYGTEGAASDAYLAAIPIFWGGQRLDADTGMYEVGGRWYDPVTGRYLSPHGVSGLEPNAYRFVGNRGEARTPSFQRADSGEQWVRTKAFFGSIVGSLDRNLAEPFIKNPVDAFGIAREAHHRFFGVDRLFGIDVTYNEWGTASKALTSGEVSTGDYYWSMASGFGQLAIDVGTLGIVPTVQYANGQITAEEAGDRFFGGCMSGIV